MLGGSLGAGSFEFRCPQRLGLGEAHPIRLPGSVAVREALGEFAHIAVREVESPRKLRATG